MAINLANNFIRAFSSSSPFLSSNLIINSSPDKLNFVDGKSILFLPSICLIDSNVSNYIKDEYDRCSITNDLIFVSNQDSLFHKQLLTIFNSLDLGEYTFRFYFYVEGKTIYDTIDDVYTSDGLDNKCLNKMELCSYGYKRLLGSPVLLDGDNTTLELAHLFVFVCSGLNILESTNKFNFNIMHRDINKEVLLVITKNTGNEDSDGGSKDWDIKIAKSSETVADILSTPLANHRVVGLRTSNISSICNVITDTSTRNGSISNTNSLICKSYLTKRAFSSSSHLSASATNTSDTVDNSKSSFSSTSFYKDIDNINNDLNTSQSPNKSFKVTWVVQYLIMVNTIIRNNPVNEETQKKIEQFLFDYSYISLENKFCPPPPKQVLRDEKLGNNK